MMRKFGVGGESMVAEPKMMFVVQTGKTKGPPTLAIASYVSATRLAGCRSSRIGEGERTRRILSKRKKEYFSNGTVAKQRRGSGCVGDRKDIRVAEIHEKRRRLFGTLFRQPGHISSVAGTNDAGKKLLVGVGYNVTEVSRNGVGRRMMSESPKCTINGADWAVRCC